MRQTHRRSWRWRTRTQSMYFSNKLGASAKTPHHPDPAPIYFIPHVFIQTFSHYSTPLFVSHLSTLAYLERASKCVPSNQYLYAWIRQLLWWGNSRWLPGVQLLWLSTSLIQLPVLGSTLVWTLIRKPPDWSNREPLTPIVILPDIRRGSFFSPIFKSFK